MGSHMLLFKVKGRRRLMHRGAPLLHFYARQHLRGGPQPPIVARRLGSLWFPGYGDWSHCNIHVLIKRSHSPRPASVEMRTLSPKFLMGLPRAALDLQAAVFVFGARTADGTISVRMQGHLSILVDIQLMVHAQACSSPVKQSSALVVVKSSGGNNSY